MMQRRRFLSLLGLGGLALASDELVKPVRRFWQVPLGAPVGCRYPDYSDAPLLDPYDGPYVDAQSILKQRYGEFIHLLPDSDSLIAAWSYDPGYPESAYPITREQVLAIPRHGYTYDTGEALALGNVRPTAASFPTDSPLVVHYESQDAENAAIAQDIITDAYKNIPGLHDHARRLHEESLIYGRVTQERLQRYHDEVAALIVGRLRVSGPSVAELRDGIVRVGSPEGMDGLYVSESAFADLREEAFGRQLPPLDRGNGSGGESG